MEDKILRGRSSKTQERLRHCNVVCVCITVTKNYDKSSVGGRTDSDLGAKSSRHYKSGWGSVEGWKMEG